MDQNWMIGPLDDEYVPEASRQILLFDDDENEGHGGQGTPAPPGLLLGSGRFGGGGSGSGAAGGPDADSPYLVPLMPLVVSSDGGALHGGTILPSAVLEAARAVALPAGHGAAQPLLSPEQPAVAWPAGVPVAVAIAAAAAAAALPGAAAGGSATTELQSPPPPAGRPTKRAPPAAKPKPLRRQQAAAGRLKKPTQPKPAAGSDASTSSGGNTLAADKDDQQAPAAVATSPAALPVVVPVLPAEAAGEGDGRRPRRAAAQRLLDSWKLDVLADAAADSSPRPADDGTGSGEDDGQRPAAAAAAPLPLPHAAAAGQRQERKRKRPTAAMRTERGEEGGEEGEETSSWEGDDGEEETESSSGGESGGGSAQRRAPARRRGGSGGGAGTSGAGQGVVRLRDLTLKPGNFKAESSATSTFKGVTKHKNTGKFEAHIWDGSAPRPGDRKRPRGKQVYLGSYATEEAAARVYDVAALLMLPEGAPLNYNATDYDLSSLRGLDRSELLQELRRSGAPRSEETD